MKKKQPAEPKKPKKKRTVHARTYHSDDFIAAALALLKANGGNVRKTARQLNLPHPTLQSWATGKSRPVAAELKQVAEINLIEDAKSLASRICTGLTVDATTDIQKGAVAFGILVDKLLVMNGLPNQISQMIGGQPTNPNGSPKYDLSKLTPAELHQLAEISAKAAGEPPVEYASDLSNPVIAPWAQQGDDEHESEKVA